MSADEFLYYINHADEEREWLERNWNNVEHVH